MNRMEESRNRCRKMTYEPCGNYLDGLVKNADQVLDYSGKEFIGLQNRTTSTFATLNGESLARVAGAMVDNPLNSILKNGGGGGS